MPSDYGPGGKWIHDRAHGIMSDGETPKDIAYAVATQQAHKVGKSPKGLRTSQGVHEAKQKYDEPKSEYQKTAMLFGLFDELEKVAIGISPETETIMKRHFHLPTPGGMPMGAFEEAGRHFRNVEQPLAASVKRSLPTVMARQKMMVARTAKKTAPGFLSRLLGRN